MFFSSRYLAKLTPTSYHTIPVHNDTLEKEIYTETKKLLMNTFVALAFIAIATYEIGVERKELWLAERSSG